MKVFKGEDYLDIVETMSLIEEQVVDIRKGVPQVRFVTVIEESEYFDSDSNEFKSIPTEFIGTWISDDSWDGNEVSYNNSHVCQDYWRKAKIELVEKYVEDV